GRPDRGRTLPPHFEQQIAARRRRPEAPEDLRRRLATLERRRTATLYDIEQGELAAADDNPWKQRIRLLTEALETVEQDYATAEQVTPGPYHPLPETPLTGLAVVLEEDVATVQYRIGDEKFVYEEPLDWAERGHQITRLELRKVAGDASKLVPSDTPAELRDELLHHLTNSLFVLATVLRDRRLEEESLPEGIVLADLARPCPTCGGWTDYRGRCQNCAQRSARLQELFRERTRLLNDRAAEIEEQHRMVERLPLARRRLADVEAEIATIEQQMADQQGS
ncbi:MAG TPA: hypothetical protein VD789_02510, partial [Thermomicrobiales bacterium]|nr:hypothetical protein [Thermomicrobiales bacterium]